MPPMRGNHQIGLSRIGADRRTEKMICSAQVPDRKAGVRYGGKQSKILCPYR